MKTISVINQKGGVGKTTIAVNLAMALKSRGFAVELIDADFTQESAMTWAALNKGEYFDVVVIQANQVKAKIERNKAKYDFTIIDCPPRANTEAGKFISVSDLVLIPVQPSPYDVWACMELVEIIQARKDLTWDLPGKEGLPDAAFVISRAARGTRLVGETLNALKETGFDVLEGMTTQYEVYKRSAMTGLTVYDALEPIQEAINQIEDIANEILERLHDEG